jgi:hypothetical protein
MFKRETLRGCCPAAQRARRLAKAADHCNRAVPGRDIASRTRCREETRHVLQHIDLADPQSSRRLR